MGYIKFFVTVSLVMFLAGCASLSEKDKTFNSGYQAGVKENITQVAGRFNGNDFPYFSWISPIVQNVLVPAHIQNGIFIPEHNEPVLIEPGEWKKVFSYPIKSKQTQNQEGEEGYALNYLNFNVRDITVLPQSYDGVKSGDKKENRY